MDIGVVGNRRSVACELMLPVKLVEYVSLGIPAVVPRLKTIEHYFSDDMVTYYEPDDVQSLADVDLPAVQRACRTSSGRPKRRVSSSGEYGWDRQGAELVNVLSSTSGELKP